jgi:apolipoprotein N-acyltransferase
MPKEVKDIHFQMQAFRAIENGFPLVRAASNGISTAFDPWGRVLGLADDFAADDGTMTAQVPIGGMRTLYTGTGDLFAWLCVAALAIGLGAAAFAPRARSPITERLGPRAGLSTRPPAVAEDFARRAGRGAARRS